jgi:multisubunit Na+/H+ antiporter MnhE subunit
LLALSSTLMPSTTAFDVSNRGSAAWNVHASLVQPEVSSLG